MKNVLLYFLFLATLSCFSQIKIGSLPLELKRNSDFHQLYGAVNEVSNEFFVIASDKEKTYGYLYNRALFFKDSLAGKKPFNYKDIVGISFDDEKAPTVYWMSEDKEKIVGMTYDFEARKINPIFFNVSFKNKKIIVQKDYKNKHIIVTKDEKNNQLELTIFQARTVKDATLSLDNISFINDKNKPISFKDLTDEFPVVPVEEQLLNPLPATSGAIKCYFSNNRLIFTLDHHISATQVLEIDLEKPTNIIEKKFNHQHNLGSVSKTNSFLKDSLLLQLLVSQEKLELNIVNYHNQSQKSNYQLGEKLNTFAKTDFFQQYQNYPPEKINQASKFIKKVYQSEIALQAYRYKDNYWLTLGGITNYTSSGDIILGLGSILSGILTGVDFGDIDNDQPIFTKSYYTDFWYQNKKMLPYENSDPLAFDKIGYFLSENKNIYLFQTIPYTDYFIFCYYDPNTEELVLRKITHGYFD